MPGRTAPACASPPKRPASVERDERPVKKNGPACHGRPARVYLPIGCRVTPETNQLDAAIQAAERAVALSPQDPAAHARHGEALYAAGKLAEAFKAFRTQSTLSPKDHVPLVAMANILDLIGDAPATEDFSRRAIALCPT